MNRHDDDFLPREYIEHQQDRRLHAIALTLLFVVLCGVGGAWWAKRAQWNRVQESREAIEEQYRDAARQAELMTDLLSRHADVMARSMLAASLVDHLPRSILLSEFINRLPDSVGLMEYEITTELVQVESEPTPVPAPSNQPDRGSTAAQAKEAVQVLTWRTDVTLIGFAPTDVHVSAFMAELNTHPLLEDVTLSFSEKTDVNGVDVRRFRITTSLAPGADVRSITPRLSTGEFDGNEDLLR